MCTLRPLYMRFAGQNSPQPAYLYLNSNGSVECEYSGSIGNGMSLAVFNHQILRFRIDCQLSGGEIDNLVEELKPLLTKLHTENPIQWNACRGCMSRGMGESLDALCEQIQRVCDNTYSEFDDHCGSETCDFCNI